MEIGEAQLGLEDSRQCNRIVRVRGDHGISMSVVLRHIQNGLRFCKRPGAKLKYIMCRIEMGHGIVSDAREVEHEGVVSGGAGA